MLSVKKSSRGRWWLFVLYWGLVLGWATMIFVLSHQPGLASPFSFDLILRKIAHVAVFGILFLLLYGALRRSVKHQTALLWAAVFTVLYAVSDEVHQSFVVDRHGSVLDVGIDSIGILIAAVVLRWRAMRGKGIGKS